MAVARPVILLAFANDLVDRANFLRNLDEERRLLKAALETAHALCDVEVLYNATLDDIRDAFQKPKLGERIAIFHFGGHADGYDLLFQSRSGDLQRIDGRGFAAFLAEQRSLQLVFLNACSTEPQIDDLLAANVQVVIATAQDVDDGVATTLAALFYQELARGASIGPAYRQAVATLRAQKGDNPDLFYAAGVPIQPPATTAGKVKPDAVSVEAGGSASGGLWPWRLRTRRGAEAAVDWSLPQAAGNPLYGLPALPPKPLPDSPYQRALDYYTRDMAELFFGRARQIRELYQRVTATGQSRVILYYGQSGVGKSSLLDAGLAPRLEASHAVLYARRDRNHGLLGTLQRQLAASILAGVAAGASAEPPAGDATSLVQTWLAAEQHLGKPLVLILDQVEEVFSRRNPDQPHELEDFAAALAAIDGGQNRPAGVLLLGFRKERLAEIETALREQRVDFAKLYLAPLDEEGIQEVFWGPVRNERLQAKYNLAIEDHLPELVAHDLTADPDSPVAPTLNILLRKLWAAGTAQAASAPRFTVGLYEHLRRDGILLDDFLRQQTGTLAQEQPDAVTSGLLLDLWAFHTTALGTSDQRDGSEVKAAYGHQPSVEALILRSKELYVLADPPGDNAGEGSDGTRLAHDTLAPLVRRDYATSALPGQQARRLLESRAIDWHDGRSGPLLDDAALALIDKGLAGMRSLSEPEGRLLAASRQAQAQRARSRRLWRGGAAAAALVVLLLLGATLVFWNNQRLATADREAALANLRLQSERADRQEAEAQINESRRLVQLAQQQLAVDQVASLHLAMAALPTTPGQPAAPEAEYALRQATLASRERKYITATVTAPGQVAIAGNRIATGGMTPAVYDLELNKQAFSLPPDFANVEGLRWGGDGRLLGWSRDAVWVLGGGEPQRFALDPAQGEQVRCAEWQPTQRWVAICTYDSLYAWELGSGRILTLTTALDTPEFPTEPRSAVWSSDGRRLAGLGARLVLWDSRTPAVAAQTFDASAEPNTYLTFAAWMPDGRSLVATGTPGPPTGINLYRWQEGAEGLRSVDLPGVTDGRNTGINTLYAPDPQNETPRLLFWSNDGLLALYNLQSEQIVEFDAPPGLNGLVLSPAGDRAVGYFAGGSAIVWSVSDLRVLKRLDATIQFIAGSLASATWLDNDSLVLADQSGLAQLVRLDDSWAAEPVDTAQSSGSLQLPGSEPLDGLPDAAFPPVPPTGPPQLLTDNNDPSIGVEITRLPGAANPNERIAAATRVANGRLLTAGYVDDGSRASLRLWQVDLMPLNAGDGLPAVQTPLCERLPQVLSLPSSLTPFEVHTWWAGDTFLIETEEGTSGWRLGGATHLLPADPSRQQITVAPDAGRVLRFGDGVDGQIWRLDESAWVQEMEVAGEIIAAQWDVHGLLLAFADGSGAVLDPQSGQSNSLPQDIDVTKATLPANNWLLAAQGADVALWQMGGDQPVAVWSAPPGQELQLDDYSIDGQLFVYRDIFSGHVYVLRTNVSVGVLTEVWRNEQTVIDSSEAHLHPTLPLLAMRSNSILSLVDLDAGSILWQSSSVAAVATQIFRAVQWSTDGQYLITQAQPAQESSLLIHVGIWRWDGVRKQPVLLQEVTAERLLGVSPDTQWMLTVEAESMSPLAIPRTLLVPIFTDTAQLQADVETSCLLTRPLSEQQRQAFLIDGR